jgi:hypothetical protein
MICLQRRKDLGLETARRQLLGLCRTCTGIDGDYRRRGPSDIWCGRAFLHRDGGTTVRCRPPHTEHVRTVRQFGTRATADVLRQQSISRLPHHPSVQLAGKEGVTHPFQAAATRCTANPHTCEW